ncbi:MAG: serine/threonine-protein phosphatase, partial [Pirellulaceae bacterium]|nr:serine/threonine-protein phosphatase [Pirellulaceae bacterium]
TAHGATDIGRKRESNQDQFLVARLNHSMSIAATSLQWGGQSRLYGADRAQLLMVADGMGGHAAGERASSIAVDHMIRQLLNNDQWLLQMDDQHEQDFVDALKELLQDTHAAILSASAEDREQEGMGTTLTMAYVIWPRVYVAHAGDSRCYLIRDGEAEQLTTDHTLARQMVEAGGLKPEDEAGSKFSNVLWNVLGGHANGELIAEVRRAELQNGDTIILCSDGLHRYLDADLLVDLVDDMDDPRMICERLIEHANDQGGEDNITVVVSQPEGKQDRDSGESTSEFLEETGESAEIRSTDIDIVMESDDNPATDLAADETLPEF